MPKRLLLLLGALLAVGAVGAPSVSAAQDSYNSPTRLNNPGQVLPEVIVIGGDGTESNIGFTAGQSLPGLGPEPDLCYGNLFGATAWYELHPDVAGTVTLEVKGDESGTPNNFDGVLGWYLFNRTSGAHGAIDCVDDQQATSPEFGFFDVAAGRSYKIQVGGYDNGVSGPYQDFYRFQLVFLRDRDGDGVYDNGNPRDACPDVPGTLANGCNPPVIPRPRPLPDTDLDGIPDDGRDKCLGENARARDANANGCLDYATLSPVWRFKPSGYFRLKGRKYISLGVRVNKKKKFGVTSIPTGARVAVTCTKRACKKQVKVANRGGSAYFPKMQGKRLKAGVKVTIRVTRAGYVGRVRRYIIKRNDVDSLDRCVLPNKSALKKSCSTIR